MIKDLVKSIVSRLAAALVAEAVIFAFGYFALDFTGAFAQFPWEFSLLFGGCIFIVVAAIVWAEMSARKELEKSYSKKIENLKAENSHLEKDYGIVNDELTRIKKTMEELERDAAIKQARDRDASWSQGAK